METNLDNPVWVSNSSNLLNLQKNYQKDQKIQFECVNCGKTEIKRLRNFRKYKEKPFLCRKCRTIETNLKKYRVFLEKFLQENAYIFNEIDYYCFIFDFFRMGCQYVEELGKVYWRDGNLCIEKW